MTKRPSLRPTPKAPPPLNDEPQVDPSNETIHLEAVGVVAAGRTFVAEDANEVASALNAALDVQGSDTLPPADADDDDEADASTEAPTVQVSEQTLDAPAPAPVVGPRTARRNAEEQYQKPEVDLSGVPAPEGFDNWDKLPHKTKLEILYARGLLAV